MMRSARGNGSARHRTASTTLKTAVFAPMPSASASTATTVKPGWRRSIRRLNITSCRSGSHIVVALLNSSAIGGTPRTRAARSHLNAAASRSASSQTRHHARQAPRRDRMASYSSTRSPAIGSARSAGSSRFSAEARPRGTFLEPLDARIASKC